MRQLSKVRDSGCQKKKIFRRIFHPRQELLELGSGVGRISIALYEMGFTNIKATDLCPKMVRECRRVLGLLNYDIPTQVVDATSIPFADNSFDGVIFGFNGLMQIPGAAARLQAVREVFSCVAPWAFLHLHYPRS